MTRRNTVVPVIPASRFVKVCVPSSAAFADGVLCRAGFFGLVLIISVKETATELVA